MMQALVWQINFADGTSTWTYAEPKSFFSLWYETQTFQIFC